MPGAEGRSGRRAGGGRRRGGDSSILDRQRPFKQIVNPFPPLAPMTPEQLEKVHLNGMRIIEEIGIEVMSADARRRLREAGAETDEGTGIVRMDRALVMDLVGKAPETFTLTPWNPERAVTIGGNVINFGMVSGPPNVHDAVRGRRPGNFRDYKDLMKLAQSFNVITMFGNQTLAPTDLAANTRHLDTYLANLIMTDKVFSGMSIGSGRVRDLMEMQAIARGLSVEDLAASPSAITNINVNSPRKLDKEMSDAATTLAERGQAVVVTPFTLMGAMTPVTIPAALAQQNAEALLTIALIQAVRPGAPVIYGCFTSNVDMRTGAPAFGTPENAWANLAGGQLARHYGLPYRTSSCNASNVADAQAVYETEMVLWGAVMGHGNLIYHAAGWLEGGLVASFEKLILDVEILQNMAAFLEPVNFSDAEFAFEAIRDTEPGGHFFGAAHTMDRFKTAFYEPLVSDWQNHENWELAGGLDASTRATEMWQQALERYQEPPLPQDRREALEAYVAQRKEEIGSGEP
ncbi:trimethylamine methyltransferase family protein [Nisaea sp.]|uniref:trimethylamine methyltransferase family protein n=1 Tax=Nisaea sp. TaxID=2024842 RepID=UPI003297B041